MNKKILSTLLISLLLTSIMFFMLLGPLEMAKAADQSSNSNGDTNYWPMFHSDPTHSGVGTGNPLLNPTVLWSYNTSSDGGGHVYSSPTIANGVVYISSWIFNIVNKMFVTKLWQRLCFERC